VGQLGFLAELEGHWFWINVIIITEWHLRDIDLGQALVILDVFFQNKCNACAWIIEFNQLTDLMDGGVNDHTMLSWGS